MSKKVNLIVTQDLRWRPSNNYSHPKIDFFRDGYAPPGGYIKDYGIIRKGDTFHLFHITGNPSQECNFPGNEIFFGHATTKDFETWTNHLPVMFIRPGTWEGGHVCDPQIMEHDGRYVMCYTGETNEIVQQIGLAFSDDLFTWTRCEYNPIWNPLPAKWAQWRNLPGASCRSPFIIKHGGEFHLIYLVYNKAGKGVLGRAVSTDLIQWEDAGPVVENHEDIPEYEAATIYERNGTWYLFSHLFRDCVLPNQMNWVSSDRLDWFDVHQFSPIWDKNFVELKVVEKDKVADKWLVMGFFWDYARPLGYPNSNPKNARVHLGILDWTKDPITITTVTKSSEVKPFL